MQKLQGGTLALSLAPESPGETFTIFFLIFCIPFSRTVPKRDSFRLVMTLHLASMREFAMESFRPSIEMRGF